MLNRIIAIALLLSASCWAGQEREGGDDVALAFEQAYNTAYIYLKVHRPDVAVRLSALSAVAKKTKVIVVDRDLYVTVNGVKQRSTAINSPSTRTIWLNRDRWQKIVDPHVAEALALHEFACLAKLEQTGNYLFSAQYVGLFGYASGDVSQMEGGPPVSRLAVTAVTGVSNYLLRGGAVALYGTTAGVAGRGKTDQDTFNSCMALPKCTTAPLCTCSTSRIWDGLAATIRFSGGTGHTLRGLFSGLPTGIPITSISETEVSVPWHELCLYYFGSSTCEGVNGQGYFSVFEDVNEDGIYTAGEPMLEISFNLVSPPEEDSVFADPRSEGIGGFAILPGDQRLYIKNVLSAVTFPVLSYGTAAAAVRFYVSKHSLLEAIPMRADYIYDIPILADTRLGQDYLPGLLNGTRYFVRLALVDQAGSVVQFYPALAGLPAECTTAPSGKCAYAGVPGRVKGH